MPSQKNYASAAEKQSAYRRRCKAQRGIEPAAQTLSVIPSTLGYLRWEAMRRQAMELLEQVASEMETYYDQRSETWQESERAEAFTEVLESVAELAAGLRDLQSD